MAGLKGPKGPEGGCFKVLCPGANSLGEPAQGGYKHQEEYADVLSAIKDCCRTTKDPHPGRTALDLHPLVLDGRPSAWSAGSL